MNRKDMTDKVNRVLTDLVNTNEFSDRIEIAKWLLTLILLVKGKDGDLVESIGDITDDEVRQFVYASDELREMRALLQDRHQALPFLIQAVQLFKDEIVYDSLLLTNTIISCVFKDIKAGITTEPIEISRLLAFVVKQTGIDDVFDPFAKLASYVVTEEFAGISFKGLESQPDCAFIANLRLMNDNREPAIEVMDPLPCWSEIDFSEALVTIPPFGKSIKDSLRDIYTSQRYVEGFVIEQFIESSVSNKAVLLLPLSLAYSYKYEELRRCLWERNYIDMVISLPAGALYDTSIPTVILVLDKTRNSDTITFVALYDCFNKGRENRIVLDLEKAKQRLSSKTGRFVVSFPAEQGLLDYNYSLNPGLYVLSDALPSIPDSSAHSFIGLFDFVAPDLKRVPLGNRIKVVGIKDLEDEYSFMPNAVSANSEISSKYYELNQPAILVGWSGSRLKVGFIQPQSLPILVSSNIVAIKHDSYTINSEYLMLELTKPYVQEEISLLGMNHTVGDSAIIHEILRKLQIVYVGLAQQEKIVEKAKAEALSSIRKRFSLAVDDYRADVRMKKHALGQVVFDTKNWWSILTTAIDRSNGFINVQQSVSKRSNTTVADVLSCLEKNITRIQRYVDRFDPSYGFTKTKFDVLAFVSDFIENNPSICAKCEIVCIGELEAEMPTQYMVEFSKDALETILLNIKANAEVHGFRNIPAHNNIIRIELGYEGSDLVLSVANNGQVPLLTSDKIFAFGETTVNDGSHFGTGGYEIRHLMHEFNGDAVIEIDPSSEYTITYRLIFKNTFLDE